MARKYNSYYLYQKYCNIGGQGMIPVYPNVYSNDADGTQSKRLHVSGDTCCNDVPAKHRTTSGSPYCDNSYNKCIDVYDQISYDDGETWETTATTTTVLEYESEYCRAFRWINMDINTDYWCEPCSGTTPQFKVRGYGDTPYSAECNSSSVLTSGDTPSGSVTVEIGKCVTSIDKKAFSYYDFNYWPPKEHRKGGINNVYIPSTVTSIPDGCFSGLTQLTSVILPETITSIGIMSFSGCVALQNIDLWDSITSIGRSAFYDCDSLISVNIPSGLTKIEWYCFANCGALLSISIPNTVTEIGYEAFYNCSGLTDVDIQGGIIGTGAFSGCTNIFDLTIGSGVTEIQIDAFRDCRSLTSLDIPDSVTLIADAAFRNCSGLISVTIGSGITDISYESFRACSNLTSITIKATVPPTLGDDAFYGTNNCPIYVPAESVETYKSASNNWHYVSNRIQAIPT